MTLKKIAFVEKEFKGVVLAGSDIPFTKGSANGSWNRAFMGY